MLKISSNFEDYLQELNLSPNTVSSYMWTIQTFFNRYKSITKKTLNDYKVYLIENFKPQTVNLRIQAINRFLIFSHNEKLKMKPIRLQQKSFLENVISNEDYRFLKKSLLNDGLEDWYFMVWFMTATGARISELLQIKAEHVHVGYLDLYSKGGKTRRIFIPVKLKNEAVTWLKKKNIDSGYIFLNRYGKRFSSRGIAIQLKVFAERYGINKKVVYPHSFRHRFAKNFLDRYNDISLLADLMGHNSIETTRIYLRKTASEQQQIVNEVVDW